MKIPESRFPPIDARPEEVIFGDLEKLCTSKGFIHVIALFCYHDNLIRYKGDKITEEDLGNQYSQNALLRTEISTLIGLMIKHPIDAVMPSPKVLQEYINRSENLHLELHGALIAPMMDSMNEARRKGTKNDPFRNAEIMREPIFYGGESAYNFQYSQLAKLKFQNDNDWLKQNKKFDIDDACAIALAFTKFQPQRLIECVEKFKTSPPDEWTVLQGFCFTKENLVEATNISNDAIDGFLDAFSCNLEAKNSSFTSLSEFNETNAAPILKMDESSYVLLQQYSLQEAIYDSPFFWMGSDDDYKSTAFKHRGQFTESFITDCLSAVFGQDRVFTNIDIYKGKNRYCEADVLVVYGDRAIVVQAKSKRLTLEARKGNDLQLKKDFKLAIQDASDQCLLCSQALCGDGFRYEDSFGKKLEFKIKPRVIFPICAVSDHFPALARQVRQSLQFTSTQIIQPPLVVDVFTVDVMAEMLNTPLHFLNYLSLRARGNEKIVVSHEMTTLGYHLKQNLWLDEQYNFVNLGDDFSASLDIAMMARRVDAPGEKTPKGILTRFKGTNIGRLLDDIEEAASPQLTGLGLLFLQLGSEAAKHINTGFDQIVRDVQRDGSLHDFSVQVESSNSGFTVHCSHLSMFEAQEKLQAHCKLRKYVTKFDAWYGVMLDPKTGRISGALINEDTWKQDAQLEQALQNWTPQPVQPLSSLSQHRKKIGRNEQCPCGSGKKHKRCCIENRK